MKFQHLSYLESRTFKGNDICTLVDDGWDDFGFKTLFHLNYYDSKGSRYQLGDTKIMRRASEGGRTELPSIFPKLGPEFASLGSDQNYYENVAALGEAKAASIFSGLRDAAWNLNIYKRFREEDAMQVSLLRGIQVIDVRSFASLAHGESVQSPFHFDYKFPGLLTTLEFRINPKQHPPTNISAIIARNGVGKTTLIRNMIDFLCNGLAADPAAGHIKFQTISDGFLEFESKFSNLVNVAFSAFDEIELPNEQANKTGLKLSYIGLRRPLRISRKTAVSPPTVRPKLGSGKQKTQLKSIAELTKEFVDSALECIQSSRKARWLRMIAILESDPMFRDMNLSKLTDLPDADIALAARRIFKPASSGHKIVLLTLTRLVQLVSERTLVLIDEPEAHLHPPLQAAFVRALSELLHERNGVAILATHSPVMLQEVPSECVWLLYRDGTELTAVRPRIETFAENVGTLTSEVFGLEVTESGFHTLLKEAMQGEETLDDALQKFNGKIGSEGRAIARGMWRRISK